MLSTQAGFLQSMASYSYESMVRGYHINKEIWEAVDGDIRQCKRERSNQHDPFAVAIIYMLLLRSCDYAWVE